MTKLRIKTKILLLTLGITAFCALSFLIMASYVMHKGGKDILVESINLGKDAAEKSRTTLEEQAKLNLTRLVSIQTQNGNRFFNATRVEVNIMKNLSKFLWVNTNLKQPLTDDTNKGNLSYLYRLAPGVDKQSVKKEFLRLRTMGSVFNPHLVNNKNIDSFFLGTQTGINIIWPDTKGKTNKPYDPRIRPWYIEAVKRNGIGWTEIFRGASTSKLLIACSGPVHDDQGKLRGVIGITVTLDEMLDVISSQIKDIGYAFLLDNKGNVIAFPALGHKEREKDYGMTNLLQIENTSLKGIVKKMVAGQSGFSKIRLNSGEKFIGFAPINETNWSMAVVISSKKALKLADETKSKIMDYTLKKQQRISKQIYVIQKYTILFFSIILLITILIAVKMSDKLSKPILNLIDGVQHVGKGDLNHRLEIKTGDEIETLANAFNKMTNDLKLYIQNLKETTAAKKRIESELQVATRIQASMLPRIFPSFPKRKDFHIFANMDPAKEVGGDLFDFFLISENKLCFVIGDVSGKGVPASLFMVITKTLIKNEALRGIPPEEIFISANNALCEDNDECMFVTGFICIIDLKTGQVDFSNAGHNPPLLLNHQTKDCKYLKVNPGFVLGGIPDFSYVKQSLHMSPGDILFLYTDGVTEAMDPDNNEYTEERLWEIISIDKSWDVSLIIESVTSDLKKFTKGAEQSDDITMLTFKYNGPQP
ncbi:MAG: SpoIIE family protein phosphatase [Desulfobacteraceae bacterium]|nr:SpoIIE family protein phosphatase [Desulfobacteraceae bacterium]